LDKDLADLEALNDMEASTPGSGFDESVIRGGDISIRFWKNLREAVAKEGTQEVAKRVDKESNGGVGLLDRVMVEWPVAMLLTTRI